MHSVSELVRAGSRAVVLGAGRSGRAALALLAARGMEVALHDEHPAAPAGSHGISSALPVLTACPDFRDAALCVVSPGIPIEHRWVQAAAVAGVPIVGELALGAALCRCPLIAVTGTNGKTTCVRLIRDLLAAADLRAEVAGNIGTPVCERVDESSTLDWLVLEVSSFQLESAIGFHPRVALLLNIQPDHMDRHPSHDVYERLKCSIFDGMGTGDLALVEAACLPLARKMTKGTPMWVPFGREREPVSWRPGAVELTSDAGVQRVLISGSRLDNPTTGSAVAASLAVVQMCAGGPSWDGMAGVVRDFLPPAHRYEWVCTREGISFIDDSKATNLTAMIAALERTDGPVLLIAGGMFKEKEAETAKEVLARKARCVYLIGRDAGVLGAAWTGSVPCLPCGTMEKAVREAWSAAQPGDVVLLSPACASFDQYTSYAVRGDDFRNIVQELS